MKFRDPTEGAATQKESGHRAPRRLTRATALSFPESWRVQGANHASVTCGSPPACTHASLTTLLTTLERHCTYTHFTDEED